jgi:hypothetical protein
MSKKQQKIDIELIKLKQRYNDLQKDIGMIQNDDIKDFMKIMSEFITYIDINRKIN